MKGIVECWHCKYYSWFSVNNNNSLAKCSIKNKSVAANERVCSRFMLHEAIYTKRDIPDYCIHYHKSEK
jgi:hypothetical protein